MPRARLLRFSLAALTVVLVAVGLAVAKPYAAWALSTLGFAPAYLQDQPDGDTGPERVVLLLTSTGFDQETITLHPGAKVLLIDNASGSDNLVFTVTRPGQDATITSNVRRGGRYEELVPFGSGDWTVTEQHHPDWVCQITVTP